MSLQYGRYLQIGKMVCDARRRSYEIHENSKTDRRMSKLIILTVEELSEILESFFNRILKELNLKEETFWTVSAAAKKMNISPTTLRKKIDNGLLELSGNGKLAESEINRYLKTKNK
jgi:hypothetical protein